MFHKVSSMVAVVLLSVGMAYGEPEFQWLPVSASGVHIIDGNQITLICGGNTVVLELRLSGWGPVSLGAYQATVDSGSYASGAGDPLTPLGWPGSPYDGAFVDMWRPDYVFSGVISIPAVAALTLDYQWGAQVLPPAGATDGGETYYGGTLVLEIPLGASGTYTIEFIDDPLLTFMVEYYGPKITPVSVTPALITIDPSGSVPAVSTWGVVVLTLLLLTAAKVAFLRPRAA